VAIFKKNDERTTYNMIYRDGPKGITFMKRFNVTGITRDKEYDLCKGTPGSEVFWFTVNPHGEAEKVMVNLRKVSGVRKLEIDADFAELQVKGRSSVGNIITKYTVKNVTLKKKGTATIASEDYWFDDSVHRLNKEERGTYLGKFSGDDKILTLTSKGYFKLYTYDLLNHFDEDIILIEKFYPQQVMTLVYFDGESKTYFTKRFLPENTTNKTLLITDHENSLVELVTMHPAPVIDVEFAKVKDKTPKPEVLNLVEFSPVVNMKAKGKKLSDKKVKEVSLRETEEEVDEDEGRNPDGSLSPMELHRRAMEKISRKAAQEFMKGKDGQTKLKLD
jgi:topoisomerase-4 subunit A